MATLDPDKFRKAGRIAANAREYGRSLIEPGRLLRDIVEAVEARIFELGGKLAFPAQISVNHIAAHYCPPPDDKTTVEKGWAPSVVTADSVAIRVCPIP